MRVFKSHENLALALIEVMLLFNMKSRSFVGLVGGCQLGKGIKIHVLIGDAVAIIFVDISLFVHLNLIIKES